MYQIRVLGGLEIVGPEGNPITSVLVQPRRAALLVYLAHAGAAALHRRDHLIGVFWPELDDEHARGALRSALYRLRSSLGEDAIVTRGADEVGLRPESFQSDVDRFRVELARQQPESALEVYRGDFLSGFFTSGAPDFDAWVDRQRLQLRQQAADAAWRVAALRDARGDFRGAVEAARRAIELRPEDGDALTRALQFYENAGDAVGAAALLRWYEQHIAAAYEMAAPADAAAIVERIRTSKARAPQPVPAESIPVDPVTPAPPDPRVARSRPPLISQRAAALVALMVGTTAIALGHRASDSRLPAWVPVQPAGGPPIARSHQATAYAAAADVVTVIGGRTAPTILNDLWQLEHASDPARARWRKTVLSGEAPAPRWIAHAAYNAGADRIILHGGALGHTSPCSDELWILANTSARAAAPSWIKLQPAGPGPAARADHHGGYDEATDRLIIYGGHDCIQTIFNDVWVLEGASGTRGSPRWQRLRPIGGPGNLRTHAAAYDPNTNRLIVFGGSDGANQFNRTWILTHANGLGGAPEWIEIKPRGAPPPPIEATSAVYDSGSNRLVIFGGATDGDVHDDVWVLVGANGTAEWAEWQRLKPAGEAPGPRYSHAAVFDAQTENMLVLGGQPARVTDVWMLRRATGR